MLPEQVINVVQIGLKYLFDIDPYLSEHLVRTGVIQLTSACEGLSSFIRAFETRIIENIAPLISDIRSLRVIFTEG